MAKVWTDEKVEMLKAFCKAGLDRRQIAEAMDTTIDAVKNAIERYKLLKFYKPVSAKRLDKISYGPLQELDDSEFEDIKEKARIKWTPAKSKRKSSKNRPFKIYLVTSDHHIPEQDDPSLKAIFKLMDDVNFDGNIILGDFMDMAPISHWTKNKRKTMESRRLKEDYLIGNAILDEFDKRLPKKCDKRFFYGNHESVRLDTDVLTDMGWKKAKDLVETDNIAQFDIDSGEITFDKPLKLHKHFSEELITVESYYSKQSVTLNHDVVVNNEKIKAHKLLDMDLKSKDLRIIGNHNSKGVDISDNDIRLLTRNVINDTDKELPRTWINLNKNQVKVLLEAIGDTDGHKQRGRYSWHTTSKNDLDLVSFLCAKNGFIYNWKVSGTSGFTETGKKQFLCNFYIDPNNHNYKSDAVKVVKEKYNNYAYCVTMPKGTIVTQLDGKVAFTGNCWYFQLIEEMPELEGLFSPTTALHLEERGYTVYENANHVEKIGKLAFTHGMYTPQNYVKKHIDEFKTNVIFGHLHSPRLRCEASVGHRISMIGYCLGCLCHKNPDYMKNKPNKWAHGFAVFYLYEDGMFDVDLKRIVDGKFIYNNVLYDGNL